jgi:hypothetical protein
MSESKGTTYTRIGLYLIGAIAVVHVWSLMRYPAPSIDEAWLTSRAWAFLNTGHPYGPLDSGLAERFYSGYWVTNQWLITALQSLVLRITASPNLPGLRILSLAWGLLLLAASYSIAFRLGGRAVAITSTLLLFCSRTFFYSAHQVRYDIMAAALAYLGVALYFSGGSARRPYKFWLGAASGLFVGLAVETHLNSLIFIPAMGILFLIDYGMNFWRQLNFWGFTCGGLLSLGFYLLVHVLPDPNAYIALNLLIFGSTHSPPIAAGIAKLVRSFSDMGGLLLVAGTSLLLPAVMALPGLWKLKTKRSWQAIAFPAVVVLAAVVLIPNKVGHYAILLAPPITWLAARALIDFMRRPWHGRLMDYILRVALLAAVGGALLLALIPLASDGYRDYSIAQAQINRVIRPGERVMGPQVYWFGLQEHAYFSPDLLIIYPRFYPGSTLSDAFNDFRPDIFIIDQGLNTLIADDVAPISRWYSYHFPRAELFTFLDANADLVSSFQSPSYGRITVYRIHWQD